MIVVTRTHNLLQNDRHFFLIDQVGSSRHIGLAIPVKDRGVDCFDGIADGTQHLVLIVDLGHHIGRVDSGEGLIMRIFQQTRRTDGDGAFHHLEKGHQIFDQPRRQTGPEEVFQNRIIIDIAQCNGIQLVRLHKLVENIGTDHHGFGNGNGEIRVFQGRIPLHHRPDKCQATPFAAQRTVTNAGEIAVFVESFFLVNRHDAGVLHAAVLHDQIENQLPGFVHIFIVAHIDMFQYFGGREHGAGIKEAGEMIPAQVVNQRIVGDLEYFLLKVFKAFDPHDFLFRLRIENDEIAEAETLHDFFS